MSFSGEVTNQDRADWANGAVDEYCRYRDAGGEEHDTVVQDLICDLLHALESENAADVVRRALSCYEIEIEDEAL